MSFFEELKRRNVVKAAVLYVIASWLILQIADVAVSLLGLPEWVGRTVFLFLALGFPLALIFSWVYELTPEGLKRERDIERGQSITHETGRKINVLIIVLLVLAIGAVIVDRLIPETTPVAQIPAIEDIGVTGPELLTDEKPASVPDLSIAVLPLADMSPGGDQEYFSDGLSEELLNLLAKVPGLRVAARTSSFSFKGQNVGIPEIAARLNVAHVLEGSVRKSGNRVRITAQLIDAETGYHLWSDTYDRELDDIFAIQDEISVEIVTALMMTLGGSDGETSAMERDGSTSILDELSSKSIPVVAKVDIRAYDLYLLGRHHWHERTLESLERALGLFQEAVTIDPSFALAYTGLADTYLLMDIYGDLTSKEATTKAEGPVARALALDDKLAEAYASLGLLRLNQDDLPAAETALRSAVDLNPNYSMAHMWLGLVLNQMSGPSAALVEYQRAIDRDPLHPSINFNLAIALGNNGQYEEAVSRLSESLEAEPDNEKAFFAMEALNLTYGHFDEAARWAMKGIREYDYGTSYLSMAKALMYLGQFDRASRYLDKAETRTRGMRMFRARADFLYISKQFAELVGLAESLDADDTRAARMIWAGAAAASSGLVSKGADELRKGLADAVGKGIEPEDVMVLMSIQAYAESASGNTAAAGETRTRALALSAEASDQGWATPQIDAVTAMLLSMEGLESDAIAKMRSAIDRGWRDYWRTSSHPAFEQMQENPEFRKLMEEVKRDLVDMKVTVDRIEAGPLS